MTLVTSQCLYSYGEKGLTYYARHNVSACVIQCHLNPFLDLHVTHMPTPLKKLPPRLTTGSLVPFLSTLLLWGFHIGAGSRHLNPITFPRTTQHLNQVMPSVRYFLIVTYFGMIQCQMAKESHLVRWYTQQAIRDYSCRAYTHTFIIKYPFMQVQMIKSGWRKICAVTVGNSLRHCSEDY